MKVERDPNRKPTRNTVKPLLTLALALLWVELVQHRSLALAWTNTETSRSKCLQILMFWQERSRHVHVE